MLGSTSSLVFSLPFPFCLSPPVIFSLDPRVVPRGKTAAALEGPAAAACTPPGDRQWRLPSKPQEQQWPQRVRAMGRGEVGSSATGIHAVAVALMEQGAAVELNGWAMVAAPKRHRAVVIAAKGARAWGSSVGSGSGSGWNNSGSGSSMWARAMGVWEEMVFSFFFDVFLKMDIIAGWVANSETTELAILRTSSEHRLWSSDYSKGGLSNRWAWYNNILYKTLLEKWFIEAPGF